MKQVNYTCTFNFILVGKGYPKIVKCLDLVICSSLQAPAKDMIWGLERSRVSYGLTTSKIDLIEHILFYNFWVVNAIFFLGYAIYVVKCCYIKQLLPYEKIREQSSLIMARIQCTNNTERPSLTNVITAFTINVSFKIILNVVVN